METPQLGARLKYLRDGAGLTQRELGARIGRSQTEIYRWEKDKVRIPADELPALTRALGVPLPAFFDVEDVEQDSVDWELHRISHRLSEEGRQRLREFLLSVAATYAPHDGD